MKLFLFTFLFLSMSAYHYAQTLDDIIEKHLRAMGNENLLEKSTVISKGKIVQGGSEIPFISYSKRPYKFRLDATIGEYTFTQAFDGQTAWVVNPMMGIMTPRELPASEAANLKFQSDFDGFLYNYKEKEHTLEYLGKDEVFGLDTHVILLVKEAGDSMHIYIDAENHLTLKTRSKAAVGGKFRYLENIFSDYRDENGILSVFDVETQVEGQTITQLLYDSYDYETAIPDSIFAFKGEAEVKEEAPEKEVPDQ